MRFYWDKDGFDGIEATFNAKLYTRRQRELFNSVMEAIRIGMQYNGPSDDIPNVFKQAFGE